MYHYTPVHTDKSIFLAPLLATISHTCPSLPPSCHGNDITIDFEPAPSSVVPAWSAPMVFRHWPRHLLPLPRIVQHMTRVTHALRSLRCCIASPQFCTQRHCRCIAAWNSSFPCPPRRRAALSLHWTSLQSPLVPRRVQVRARDLFLTALGAMHQPLARCPGHRRTRHLMSPQPPEVAGVAHPSYP